MADTKEPVKPIDESADNNEMTEAEIDQNLKDSFPASDPPSWTLGSNHAENAHQEAEKKPGDVERDTDV